MVWPFSSNESKPVDIDVTQQIAPPSGVTTLTEEIPKPKNYKPTSGDSVLFSEPPKEKIENKKETSKYSPINFNFSSPKQTTDEPQVDPYLTEDYESYSKPLPPDSPGYLDSYYNTTIAQHPRLQNCLYSIKLGAKMGATVGGVFGTIAGTYAMYVQRSFIVLPISMVGGAASFGFFLGCGMIIRC